MFAVQKRQADLVPRAIAAAMPVVVKMPQYPADCIKPETAIVRVGNRLDVALVATDAALDRANAKAITCSRWYDKVRQAHDNQTKGAAQ